MSSRDPLSPEDRACVQRMAQTIRAAILGADRAAEDEADRVARRVVERLASSGRAPERRLLSTEEAAAYAGVTSAALRVAASRGAVSPAGRRGRSLTWAVEDLDAWMVGDETARRARLPLGHEDVARAPAGEGVYEREGGGFVIRARMVHARTGRTVTICRALADETSAKRAYVTLQDLKRAARAGALDAVQTEMPTGKSFAKSLFKAKVADGSIASAKGREKWATILGHLAKAKWAEYLVDRIEPRDLQEWRDLLPSVTWTRTRKDKKTGQPVVIKTGKYAPSTLNDWLAVARVIFAAAKKKYGLPVDPMADVEDFALKGHRTYTKEEPNALTPEETATWLAKFRELYPRLFAMVLLGFVLGQRPSTLRPLRRKGKHADLDFSRGVIQLRRSHTLGDEVMEATKTFADQEVALPKSVVDVLSEHVAWLDAGYPDGGTWQQRKSELLFPSAEGKLLCRSALQKPFAKVTATCGLGKNITPRAMRRTFQDLTRKAGVSGHATDAMRVRYSTAATPEVAAAIGKVVSLATAKPRAGKGKGRKAG